MENFARVFQRAEEMTVTANGGAAVNTLHSKLLEMFASIGTMRKMHEDEIISKWLAAREENSELADNLVLYARDIRGGGIGERRVGQILLAELGRINPEKVNRNFQTIVNAGRWDDLFVFFGNPKVEPHMIRFVKNQLKEDITNHMSGKSVSLLAKWMPSINTSSKETVGRAKKFCRALRISESTYRKVLSNLRTYLDVVEKKMSANQWERIDFEKIPSLAMSTYNNAFMTRAKTNFTSYIKDVKAGKKEIKASTLYPYNIIENAIHGKNEINEVQEEQWKALPNYVDDSNEVIVMADVSPSMTVNNCKPLATSVGLATYFAQRNKGAFHGKYLTFSSNPTFVNLRDDMSLNQIVQFVKRHSMGFSTDLDKAFRAIYYVSKEANYAPKALVIISDMEIDRFNGSFTETIAEKWTKNFESIGLTAPKLILWNVEANNNRYLGRSTDKVSYISGYGVGSFKHLTDLIDKTAYEAMVSILSKDEFSWK